MGRVAKIDPALSASVQLKSATALQRSCRVIPEGHGEQKSARLSLAGVASKAEGHSWHLCANAFLLRYSWPYDKFEQAINRGRRLTSMKDDNLWSLICNGSIDCKQEEDIQTKGDAAEIAQTNQDQENNFSVFY